jgi:Flp pilus assembly protein TadD
MTNKVETAAPLEMTEIVKRQIGDAWRAHRQGQHETAVTSFRQVLAQDPNNVDALYGLGLVQKTIGDNAHARETFLGLQVLLKELQAKEDVGAPGRFFMLNNMVRQQLKFLG